MEPADIDQDILDVLSLATADVLSMHPVAGGDISSAYCWKTKKGDFFVKVNKRSLASMFAAESRALKAIVATETVRAPVPIAQGESTQCSWLVLEWLDFVGRGSVAAQNLGVALARMHRCCNARFGWAEDNFIGSSPQRNCWEDSWPRFYSHQRLKVQAELIEQAGVSADLARALSKVADVTADLLVGHKPAPSLLHGDLWGGNWASLADETAVLFDPAAYYGDRETDIAMTELFGGFPPEFYTAYSDAWPLAPGYEKRRDLYQLYHIANHALLFGGAYVIQALAVTKRLLG